MSTMNIILIAVLIIVIVFVIVTTITGRKASKKEKAQRYQAVREKIKSHLAHKEGKKNLRVEFEKVYARKGAEYKYRDVFDVIIEIIEPKTNKIIEIKAYEIEGITTKIDKKNYKTDWIVNGSLDLDDTKKRIAISEKEIKLTKEEKKALRQTEKMREKELREKDRMITKEAKKASKNQPKGEREAELAKLAKQSGQKFVPTRKKD